MKKILCLTLSLLILASFCSLFASCGMLGAAKVGSAQELHEATKGGDVEITNGSVSKYKGVKKNIEIQNDFTVSTDDLFFTERIGNYNFKDYIPGRMMQNATINGNGHTITITGKSEGSLGRYAAGLFGRLMNCEVKDLHIVYDLDLNLNSSKGSMGGICGVADQCTFTNCTVTYKKPASFSGYRAGGIAGMFSGTMQNCSVTGDFQLSLEYFGGLSGGFGEGTATHCNVTASIKADNLHNAELGGLFGWLQGEASSNKVTLSNFSVSGKTDKWTYYDAYCGGFVGKIYGNLHDCILEFTQTATFSATELSTGTFCTNMHTGVVAGFARNDAKIHNIFIDAKGGDQTNIAFPEHAQPISLGIKKNESTSANNIYYAEDALVQQYVGKVNGITETKVEGTNDRRYSFEIGGKPCSVTVCREEAMPGSFKITSLLLTLADQEYALTTKIDDHPSSPSFKTAENGFQYEATVKTEGLFVELSITMDHCSAEGVTLVSDYAEISFNAPDVWVTNTSGKPSLQAAIPTK